TLMYTLSLHDALPILGEADDEIPALEDAKDRLSMSGADGLGDEGYVLNVDPGDSAGGTIVIEGKDGDGTFYGVQTLRQLAEVRRSEEHTSELQSRFDL